MNRRELLKASLALPFAGVLGAQVADEDPVGEVRQELPYNPYPPIDDLPISGDARQLEDIRREMDRLASYGQTLKIHASPDAWHWLDARLAAKVNVSYDRRDANWVPHLYIDGIKVVLAEWMAPNWLRVSNDVSTVAFWVGRNPIMDCPYGP